MEDVTIRSECLRPASAGWEQPTGQEVRAVVKRAGFTGRAAARFLGLGLKGDRTVRRWIGNDSRIPYAAWALLCHRAGLGQIWNEEAAPDAQISPPKNTTEQASASAEPTAASNGLPTASSESSQTTAAPSVPQVVPAPTPLHPETPAVSAEPQGTAATDDPAPNGVPEARELKA